MTSLPKRAIVRVPGTMANLGPGFDSFGLAVNLYNTFTFELAERDSLHFLDSSEADISTLNQAPFDPATHLIWRSMGAVCKAAGCSRPSVKVEVKADIPVARGLGSSSTAIIAALLAANALTGETLSREKILDLSVELEHHPDNVAPALLGGIVMCDIINKSTRTYDLPWPSEWGVVALSPSYAVKTDDARKILPETLSQNDAVFNLRKASTFTYALLRENADALRDALDDRIHQPYRRKLIPEYDALEKLALESGAYGFFISGSGPTMGCFYPSVIHGSLLDTFQQAIAANNWPIQLHDVTLDRDGASVELYSPI